MSNTVEQFAVTNTMGQDSRPRNDKGAYHGAHADGTYWYNGTQVKDEFTFNHHVKNGTEKITYGCMPHNG